MPFLKLIEPDPFNKSLNTFGVLNSDHIVLLIPRYFEIDLSGQEQELFPQLGEPKQTATRYFLVYDATGAQHSSRDAPASTRKFLEDLWNAAN